MKVTFLVADRYRVECDWSGLGFEKYAVDGKEVLRKWSLSTRGSRTFKVGSGPDQHDVEIRVDTSRKMAQAYVDGQLAVEDLAGPKAWVKPWYRLTLIEVLIVAGIIGILAALALPANHGAPRYLVLNTHSAYQEFGKLSLEISDYREANKKLPERNEDIGLPADGLILDDGRHVYNLLRDGSVLLKVYTVCHQHETHCRPGERYQFGQMSLRPAVDAQGRIKFVCGSAPVPAGYQAIGENRTTMRGDTVPRQCR